MKRVIILIWILMTAFNYAYAVQFQESKLARDVQVSISSAEINLANQKMGATYQKKQQDWIEDMSQRVQKWVPNESIRRKLLSIIQYEATRAGLDPQLVLSIITIESRFNKYAISPAGALGFMQVMPFWQEKLGTPKQNLLDTQTNIRYGCTILKHYLALEHGDLYNALGRYNGSRGRQAYPNLVCNAYHKYWQT